MSAWHRRGALRLYAGLALVALQASLAMFCGGTTGREGLPLNDASADGTLRADVSEDVGVRGTFDVPIAYADRKLPDVATAGEGGDAGFPWPTCPPFAPVGPDGGITPLGTEVNQVPTAYAGDAAVIAPDGSVCASYGWLGTVADDECVTMQGAATPDYIQFPPCDWCIDAGNAVSGPRAGDSRYAICLELYACIASTKCGLKGIQTCLCGPDLATCSTDASGPCLDLELAALEYAPSDLVQAIKNYTDAVDTTGGGLASFTGHCGGALNQVYQVGSSFGCFDAGEGD